MKNFLLCVVFVCCISHCGPKPDIVSTDKKGNERYSADEVRRITVDQPFLISGDYFRERNQENTPISSLFSKSKADPEKKDSESTKTAIPEDRPDIQKKEHRNLPVLPLKVGFLIDQNQVSSKTSDHITKVIPEVSASFPVLIVEGDSIRESLSQTDCLQKKDLLCAAKTLGIYPGVRILTLVEKFSIPESYPGQAAAHISVVDTGLNYRYPVMEISAQIQTASDADTFIRGTLQSVMEFSVKKSQIMTPFCRWFSHEKNLWFITAGKKSGLSIGDTMEVMTPGTLVKSPGGLPAGWMTGKSKAKLRIDQFFGDDFAACSLIEGEAPKPEDFIIFHHIKSENG